ncbi:MAG: helicase-exonuclease AddAB subunit AddA [Clostridiales bacterium]|nr:helicase-exonuclease AddAB subunit AddA [Clostridiales bacterium]
MSVSWTREQEQVITSRGSSLLVSAAAGSGKTAVLVERIIRLITEGDEPADIDRLLVMTFTNAAAAEMRERVLAAVNRRLEEQPDNVHLQAQATLVHHASITTIDSFCLNLIRSHFDSLDLDPSFRVADEGECALLRADVMGELLEWYYANGGERFLRFVETYAQGKNDAGMEDYILQVYNFAQSNPYPAVWLDDCLAELEGGSRASWMEFLEQDVQRQARELTEQLRESLALCEADEFLCAYAPMLQSDIRQLGTLAKAEGEKLFSQIAGFKWERLATVRNKEVDAEKKARVTGSRDRAKKAVARMKELYCFAAPQEMEARQAGTAEAVRMLLELAGEFAARFADKKKERNIVDFDDLEHEALNVLIAHENGRPLVGADGGYRYTAVADELAGEYVEVLVDEYQDSSLVQEALLEALSGERFGRSNVFLVGDVKQSIYKFRLARPELFLERYRAYTPYDEDAAAKKRKIELRQNFRSRSEVLDGINDVFFRIMTENLGGIRYTDEIALHAGASYEGGGAQPELLVVDTGGDALAQLDEDAADFTAKEIEARLITARIRALTDPEKGLKIFDKEMPDGGGYRSAGFRDIVILLRSTQGWTEVFLNVLTNEGIPAYAESKTGYFNTTEVETVLSLLAVIDNPMQDIPLAAALRSSVAGVTDVELAHLTAEFRVRAEKGQDRGLYAAVKSYVEQEQESISDQALARKLQDFLSLLDHFRRESACLPIHELLYDIYERSGYYRYVSAMPAGETRRANLDMLVEKAVSYEQTSYKGLFHFIRYIENLKKYNTDFGEAGTVGEEDDTVRIMSIHKSKGLEFPIVFLAGMGKHFNRQDTYGKVLIDADLGIASDYLDPEYRLKAPTLKKNVLRRKLGLDNLGEELRVLYVAMTRARERLIMTGTDRYLAKSLEKYAQPPLVDGQLPYTLLSTAGSYLDWLLMSIGSGGVRVSLREVALADLVGGEVVRQVHRRSLREWLEADYGENSDSEYAKMLRRRLDTPYPYESDISLQTELSVSELKKAGQVPEPSSYGSCVGFEDVYRQETAGTEVSEGQNVQTGMANDTENVQNNTKSGATRGTAYHRVLQFLPFDEPGSEAEVVAFLDRLVKEQRFSQENRELVDAGEIWSLLSSPLGQRMRRAQREGRLHRERQFVMGIPAAELYAGDGKNHSRELVVIQGVIDAYMEEADGLVLIDYKTDRVWQPEILAANYRRQLEYYQKALEMATGKPVKEKLIYSLTMRREIRL